MSGGARRPNRVHLEVSQAGPAGRQLEARVRRKALGYLRALRLSGCELSVALVRDRAIHALNRQWRGKDQATDVLSFPQPLVPGARARALGDVVISVDTGRRQAKAWGRSLAQEVDRYLAHGLLHLLGYDHHRPGERRRMARAEARLLGDAGMLGSDS